MLDKELLAYLKEDKKYIYYTIILNILGLVFNVLITASLISLIYNFINNNYINGIYTILLTLLFLILRIVVLTLSNKCNRILADHITFKLREDTYKKFLNLGGDTPFTVSEMAQLSIEGIEQLRLYYSEYIPSFFYAMIAPILLFILFCFIDYLIAIIYLVCIPLIPISIILVSKGAKKIFNKYWDIYLGLGDVFLDNVKGMKELNIFLFTKERENEIKEKSEEFRKITMKVLVMQLYSVSIMDLVAYGGASIGIVLSLVALNQGLEWYLVLFMILIGAEFFLPLRRLGSVFHVAMNGATAGKKVLKLLNKEEQERPLLLNTKIEEIKINNLKFSYGDKLIINDVNIVLNKGLYSFVGKSGCGKSTIAKILANRLINYEGNVLFNSLECNKIELDNFYSKIAYIANSTYIMNESIKNTFLFYNPELTEDKMWEILKLVKLDNVIKLNGGLDFVIKDNAVNISGGEKQRLIIAYYLSKDYDFYIFDEATSNIDKESEEIILKVLKELAKTKIVLNITHRLKNVLNSNYIYYLENKEIKEEGSPNKLLLEDSNFKKILNEQEALEVVS